MNHIDDDTLQAYVDGQLDAAGVTRVEAALAHDDELARRVRQERALRAGLRAAFDPVLDEPVPAHLAALLQAEPARSVAPLRRAADARGFGAGRRRAPRRWLAAAAALAASLAVLAVGLWWQSGDELVRVRDGRQFAAGALSDALDQALASEPDAHAAIAIGLTFRSNDGRICRTFVRRSPPAMAGLACHGDTGWALPVLSATDGPEAGGLRQAASVLPPPVQAAVDARLHGDVFDARQERAARDAGWR